MLAGSAATGLTDEWSDYDLYAYSRGVVPIEFRAKFLKPRATRLELHNTFWEWSDEWVESDGTIFDLMYRSCDAIEEDVEARLGRGIAALGYSTSLCYSVLQATPVFDRRGWFKPSRAASNRPHILTHLWRGLKMNLPVLGGMIDSYEQQIRSAFSRRDRISLNHRTAAWLASYFDILFAVNRRFNPGEKRLLTHAQALPGAGQDGPLMWRPLARGLAAWKPAWPITLRPCARGWSATYKTKGCSNSSSL